MGKNNGKNAKATSYARFKSIMAKLDNELKKQIEEQKNNPDKKTKGKMENE